MDIPSPAKLFSKMQECEWSQRLSHWRGKIIETHPRLPQYAGATAALSLGLGAAYLALFYNAPKPEDSLPIDPYGICPLPTFSDFLNNLTHVHSNEVCPSPFPVLNSFANITVIDPYNVSQANEDSSGLLANIVLLTVCGLLASCLPGSAPAKQETLIVESSEDSASSQRQHQTPISTDAISQDTSLTSQDAFSQNLSTIPSITTIDPNKISDENNAPPLSQTELLANVLVLAATVSLSQTTLASQLPTPSATSSTQDTFFTDKCFEKHTTKPFSSSNLDATASSSSMATPREIFSSSQSAIAALPPIGIPNQGNTCFLAAMLQEILCTDPILEEALVEEARVEGNTALLGHILAAYRQDQAAGKSECTVDMFALRALLHQMDSTSGFLEEQHDAGEARRVILRDPNLCARLQEKSYFSSILLRRYIDTKGRIPMELEFDPEFRAYYSLNLEDNNGEIPITFPSKFKDFYLRTVLQQSFFCGFSQLKPKYLMQSGQHCDCEELFYRQQWMTPPSRFTLNVTRENLSDRICVEEQMKIPDACFVNGSGEHSRRYQLVGFTEHTGHKGPGRSHYIYYCKQGNNYYQMNDEKRIQINRAHYLKKASTAYRLTYAL